MPTSRPRYLLTESDELRNALEVARRRWPSDGGRPTALLLHLIEAGRRTVADDASQRTQRRLAAIRALSADLDGVYSEGYLADLRNDWPE